MTLDNARADAARFARLHPWYRSLPPEGSAYLVFPWRGEQPKNPINTAVLDREGVHWWFWSVDAIEDLPVTGVGRLIVLRHRVRLNCFLRGVEPDDDGTPVAVGWDAIRQRHPRVKKLLRKRYGAKKAKDVEGVYRAEAQRQVDEMAGAAAAVYREFAAVCPGWLEPVSTTERARRRARGPSVPQLDLRALRLESTLSGDQETSSTDVMVSDEGSSERLRARERANLRNISLGDAARHDRRVSFALPPGRRDPAPSEEPAREPARERARSRAASRAAPEHDNAGSSEGEKVTLREFVATFAAADPAGPIAAYASASSDGRLRRGRL